MFADQAANGLSNLSLNGLHSIIHGQSGKAGQTSQKSAKSGRSTTSSNAVFSLLGLPTLQTDRVYNREQIYGLRFTEVRQIPSESISFDKCAIFEHIL